MRRTAKKVAVVRYFFARLENNFFDHSFIFVFIAQYVNLETILGWHIPQIVLH